MRAAAFLTVTVLLTAITGTYQESVSPVQTVNAACGETVTLPCLIDKNEKVVKFYWTVGEKELCNISGTKEGVSEHIHCEYTDNHGLNLTIHQVQPSNSSNYLCKLQTMSDHHSITAALHVSECKRNFQKISVPNTTASHACASESRWMSLLVSVTLLLSLFLDSGI